MYRILIVDDERHVLDWIYELLADLKEPELDVYKAGTVTEALAWLDRSRMDIVVSDISMPGMNGIELHGKIREKWPECKVIFLTGYTDFEFAYQAVKNEAVGYILKTEDDDVIVETVLKAVRQIEENARRERLMRQAEEKMNAAIPLLRNECLSGLLRGERTLPTVRRRQFRELAIDLNPEESVGLIVARMDERQLREPVNASPFAGIPALPAVVASVTEAFTERNASCVHLTIDGNLCWLVQSDSGFGGEGAVPSAFLMETLDQVQVFCRDHLGQSLSSVLTEGTVSWAELADKYELLRQGLVRHMIYGSGFILSESGIASLRQTGSPIGVRIDRNKWEALRTHLEKGQRERFEQGLEEIGRIIAEQDGSLRDSSGMEAFYNLSLLLLSASNRWEMRELAGDLGFMEKLTSPERHVNWQAAIGFFRETANAIFDLLDKKQENGEFDVIQYVREYMSKHLHEGISLVELAEAVYFNPSYLSRLFKEVTGLSITAYLADLRLERAVAMLQENRKIGDIAAAVGIESPAYFSRFFKKMTGRTPQEYREELIIGNRS
ncbi:response regulator transcription factor [Cohnella herbarum]|uniref:Response regulator n=1 Tax=Cohnella herbarum TaxID=2728023 RepID=A0A7Z2ZN93_9BACL|nr:response regulator [Cohnella herbarum]QJD86166.1 response regulator [Cohnella herbarum]